MENFTPMDPSFVEDPYPALRALRDLAPIHEVPGIGHVVTSYDLAVEICSDPLLFSSKFGPGLGVGAFELTPLMVAELRRRTDLPPLVPTLLTTDPPEHRRYRSLSAPAFKPSRIKAMHATIQGRADELIDGFVGAGRIDLVEQFAVPFPLLVICDLLGIPAADIAHFDRWMKYGVSALGGMLSDDQREDWFVGQLDMLEYLRGHVRERRIAPRGDLIGDLIDAEMATDEGMQPLNDDEIVSIALHYLVAGHETVAKLIGNGVWLFLTHPDQLEYVKADPTRWANAVEEVLRCESPSQSMTRTTTRATRVGGVDLAEGTHCIIMIGAANRDPAKFPDPDTFDTARDNARSSLAFAHGEHFCVGANLARLEARVAFQTLFDRLPGLRLAEGENDFTHQPTWVHRGFNNLHLTFDPPRA